MIQKYWYIVDDIDKLDTPALVVYPGRVKQNIGVLKSMVDRTERLRPHIKTYKNREVTQLMLDAGITKFKCATIAEAEMLGMCKAPDVLLAYQPVGPKLERFIQLILAYPDTKYACLVDNSAAAVEISAAAVKNKVHIPVYIDLNVGMNRTGISPVETQYFASPENVSSGTQNTTSPGNISSKTQSIASLLYADCALLPGIKPVGLHAYDGHVHADDLNTRIEMCNQCFDKVSKLQAELVKMDYPEPIIVAGGSPTFPIHAKRKNVECSPGTFIYWDEGYKTELNEQLFLTAALVVSRVISLPDETKICLDLGHKSIASEKELSKRVYFINAPELAFAGHSEEHLVADAGKGHKYRVGDVLYGIPYHICPTVALYERAITIENNKVTGEWKNIARDRKITI